MIGKLKLSGTTSTSDLKVLGMPKVRLFPNPAVPGGRVFFEFIGKNPTSEPIQVQIIDIRGKIVQSNTHTIVARINEMTLPNIPSGYYQISFTGKDIRYVTKLLVY